MNVSTFEKIQDHSLCSLAQTDTKIDGLDGAVKEVFQQVMDAVPAEMKEKMAAHQVKTADDVRAVITRNSATPEIRTFLVRSIGGWMPRPQEPEESEDPTAAEMLQWLQDTASEAWDTVKSVPDTLQAAVGSCAAPCMREQKHAPVIAPEKKTQ